MNAADTSFVLFATALVMLMTVPGLALFYGGLVRKKNILNIMMQCLVVMCVISVQWVLFGYSLAFNTETTGFWGQLIGGLGWMGLHGVGTDPSTTYGTTIPHMAFMIFQMMFAVITPALIIGAFAERIKFSAFLVFSLLWTTLVYDPVCHWVWAPTGWLFKMGALDFAGGTVVHICSAVAALATILVIGKRKNHLITHSPHNLPFTAIGTGLLWFGWYGFNAGSALAANGLAVSAFVMTHIAAAMAGVSWMAMDWLFHRKFTLLGICTGAVAGLVAITPAAGFVNVSGALSIGAIVSILCYLAVTVVKPYFGYDDALDVVGVHGIGGIWGALATGLFATKIVNAAGNNGVFFGNPGLLGIQAVAVVSVILYAFVATFILFKLVDMILGVRVDARAEQIGLDLTQHQESAYTVLE